MKQPKAMTVRLDAAQAEQLEFVAMVEDMPIAEVVRVAITRHIEDRRNDEGFRTELRQRIRAVESLLGEPFGEIVT